MVHRHLGALKVNPNLDALILIFSQGTCGASAFEKDALNFKEMCPTLGRCPTPRPQITR